MIRKVKCTETSEGIWYILANEKESVNLNGEFSIEGIWYLPVFEYGNGEVESYEKHPTLSHAKDFIVDNFPMV